MREPITRHLEALGRLCQARVALFARGWQETLDGAHALAERATADLITQPMDPAELTGDGADSVTAVERALWRASRLVPGSTCIHRALAAQKMLIRRGFGARVVIGLRKRHAQLEGHAWIEAWRAGSRCRAFWTEEAGYAAVVEPAKAQASFR